MKPDVAVPAADAQKVAHASILKTLLAAATNADEKLELQETLAQVESGVEKAPNYEPPHH